MSAEISNNPFVGLRPFESEESLLFFGRQDQTLELLQRLHQHHFVAIVGGSGSGKSSLVRAGLIPRLKAGYLVDERDSWMICVMKPGQSPLYNLAYSIISQVENPGEQISVTDFINEISEKGVDAIFTLLEHHWKTKKSNLFLLVDQFEELFRFSTDKTNVKNKNEAIDFVNILLELVNQNELPIYVALTMRSDFIGDCADFFGLPEAMNQSQYLVPKLNRVQLRNVIEGPVKLFGEKINLALTSKILNDIQTVEDELPLLQHVLMRTWDREILIDKSGELNIDDYNVIGGISKALSNHADEALEGLTEKEKELAKKIFQALTTVDDNGRKIRRPIRLSQLISITNASKENILKFINRFIEDKRSFLILSNAGAEDDKVIDISHESLIRQWTTLRNWTDEEAENVNTLYRLIESEKLYNTKKKDLLTGNELTQFLAWHKSFKPSIKWAKLHVANPENSFAYLEKSEKEWKTKKLKKKWVTGFIVLGTLAGLVGLIIFNEMKNDFAHRELQKQNYLHLSQNARAENDLLKELLYAAEALSFVKNSNKEVIAAYHLLPAYYLRNIFILKSDAMWASFDDSTSNIIIWNDDMSSYIWSVQDTIHIVDSSTTLKPMDMNTYDPILPVFHLFHKWDIDTITGKQQLVNVDSWHIENIKIPKSVKLINGGIYSKDKKTILTWGYNRDSVYTANIFEAATGKQISTPLIHNDEFYSGVFNKDGRRILTWSKDSTVRLWQKLDAIHPDSADLDCPPELFKLQAEAMTGVELNPLSKEISYIPVLEWVNRFNLWWIESEKHFQKCKYPEYNYWARIIKEEIQ